MKRARRDAGIALITAMLIAALVTAGAVALAATQQFNTRRINNILTATRATRAIAALEQQAVAVLRKDAELGGFDANSEAWASAKLTLTQDGVTSEAELHDLSGRFNLTNLAGDPEFAGAAPNSTGREPAAPEKDEAGNTLPPAVPPCTDPAGCGESPEAPKTAAPKAPTAAPTLPPADVAAEQLRLLFTILELDPQPIQAIQDWIDADTDTRFPNGAEDDYYTAQTPAYRAANRPFASPRELLLVKGVTLEMYRKLAPFIVCLPRTTSLNVNTAPKEILMSLGPSLDRATAESLVTARTTQPFTDLALFQNHPLIAFRPLLQTNLAVNSEYFELLSHSRDERLELSTRTLLARQGRTTTVLGRWRNALEAP